MLLIPAIDIKNNNCVRLLKGDFKNIILFSNNPLKIFNNLIKNKPKRIHIVDLDGAFYGKPKNLLIIKTIIKLNYKVNKIQIGGGIRNFKIINFYFKIGVDYLILGTKAVLNYKFFKNLCSKFPNKIILGLDFKKNKLSLNAWKNNYNLNFLKLFYKLKNLNFNSLICTDINKDGVLNGLNLNLIYKINFFIKKPFISSGGLNYILDIKNIFNFNKFLILGVICGKSIYFGNLYYKNLLENIKKVTNIYIK